MRSRGISHSESGEELAPEFSPVLLPPALPLADSCLGLVSAVKGWGRWEVRGGEVPLPCVEVEDRDAPR